MKMIKLWILSWFALLLAACGGEGSGLPAQDGGGNPLPGVVSLQLTPAKANVPIDFSLQYVAEALLADGGVMDVTGNPSIFWSSSNLAVARIDNRGLATGVSPGTVTITASGTANGQAFSASAELTVTNAVVTALQLTPATASVAVGLEQQYTATALLSDGSSLDVTNHAALSWSSSDVAVATISATGTNGKGLATGVSPGTVTITASGTANGQAFSASAGLTVNIEQPNYNLGCSVGEVEISNGSVFSCPLTKSEADKFNIAYLQTYSLGGKEFVQMNAIQAFDYCEKLTGAYLPSYNDLVQLSNERSNYLANTARWPINGTYDYYYSSTGSLNSGFSVVRLVNGAGAAGAFDEPLFVTCVVRNNVNRNIK